MTQQIGIGQWRTRDGRKAEIKELGPEPFPLIGILDGDDAAWPLDGQSDGEPGPCDLVAPWVELTRSADHGPELQSVSDDDDQHLLVEFAKAALTGLILHNGSSIPNADYGRHALDIAEAMVAEMKRRYPRATT